MSPPAPPRAAEPTRAAAPSRPDALLLLALLGGLLLLYLPSYIDLSTSVWASDEQGHGPIILALSIWLLFQQRHELWALPVEARPLPGLALLLAGLLLYALGRSQAILLFEVGSQILVLAALTLALLGRRALRLIWFPLFFMVFMVPLPEALVASLTTPLKSAVSAIASQLLFWAGYPVGRTGVVLTVGQYQLLVADACAGLNSMFTLEALGMLYMKLMNYTSIGRNATLALLLLPISFVANVVRVMVLVLVTYHYGDAAGQGFVHGFAGIVLFVVALLLMLLTDKGLNLVWHRGRLA